MSEIDVPAPDARQRQRAESFFQHARDAAQRHNYPYAIDLLGQALKIDPTNLLYRQNLRAVQRLKFGNEPSKVGMLAGARLQPVRLRIRGEKNRGNHARVLEICEEAFLLNPWDVGTARDASEAAEGLGNTEMALWLLESVIDQGGKDAEFLRHLARVYELRKDYPKAIACYERIVRNNPADEHARRQVRALSASATIHRSGYHETIRPDDAAQAGPDIQVEGLDDLRGKSETPEQRLLREIDEQPDYVRPYLELAEIYRAAAKLDEAEKVLARGRKALPDEGLLREAHADVQLARLRRAIAHHEKKLRLDPDDRESRSKLATLREKHDAFELNELRHRAKVNATNLRHRLELGKVLARQGKHDEAIAELQQARGDENLRVEALHLSGQAFEAKGLPKLAERSYLDALKLLESDDRALALALHYRLGRVAEAQGDRASAEEHYNEVAASDYTYLDVAERLRALNQGR